MEDLILFVTKASNTKLRNFGIVLTNELFTQLDNEKLAPIFNVMIKHFKDLKTPNYEEIYKATQSAGSVDELEQKIIHILWALYSDVCSKNEMRICFTNACKQYKINKEIILNVAKAA